MKKNATSNSPPRRNLVLRRETIIVLSGFQLVRVTAGAAREMRPTEGNGWPCEVSPVFE